MKIPQVLVKLWKEHQFQEVKEVTKKQFLMKIWLAGTKTSNIQENSNLKNLENETNFDEILKKTTNFKKIQNLPKKVKTATFEETIKISAKFKMTQT